MNEPNSGSTGAVVEASTHAEAVIRDLYDRGLLDWEFGPTIEKASRVALDPDTLLTFAIGLVHTNTYHARLLHKTIDLALSLGRRVDLDWSIERSCRQYEKLVRLSPPYGLNLSGEEALAREPWRDTEWVRACLPSDPECRRRVRHLDSAAKLEREAYRQYRCMPGEEYLRLCACGELGAFAVLHGGRRWTVTVYRTLRDEQRGTAHLFEISGPRGTRPTNQVRGEVIAMLDTKVFTGHSAFLSSAEADVRTRIPHDSENYLPASSMGMEPFQLGQCESEKGIKDELETMFATAAGASKDLETLKRLVDRNMLARSTAKLLLRAVGNADDPADLLSFAIALRWFDENHVPVVHAVNLLVEQGRMIHLGWSADQWWEAYAQASLLFSDVDSKAPPRPAPTKPLPPNDTRITAVDTAFLLAREAYRQRSSEVLAYADEIRDGSKRCASVLLEGKRWTVVYSPHQAGQRDRVTSYIGADGMKPRKSVRRQIRELVA